MPHVWLTYEEFGSYIETSAEAGRAEALRGGLTRTRCADGKARILLPEALITDYFARYLATSYLDSLSRSAARNTGAAPARRKTATAAAVAEKAVDLA
jgi:hypothetical protein